VSERKLLLVVGLVLLVVSGVAPKERLTWWLEIFPILLALPALLATARRFPFTPLAYRLVFLHACVLMVGGHYTYAETPLGEWLRQWFHLSRNPYDRIGHFAQGFVPAIVAREVLTRVVGLRGGWRFFLVTSVVLAISAAYELVEWASATVLGAGADAFLGTQGDPWDTQWDMFTALVGGVVAQLLLARAHDREMQRTVTSEASR
jgi:putative membrane protein